MTQAATVVETTEGEVLRPLEVLIPLIKEQIKLAKEAAEPYWLEVGRLLNEARPQVRQKYGPGKWEWWCKENFPNVLPDARQKYMLAAEQYDKAHGWNQKPPLGGEPIMADYLRLGGKRGFNPNNRPWYDPVRELADSANIKALHNEQMKAAQERDVQRKLALKLIAIGYKILATELHPDKPGGSREAMTRLNAVRDRLKQSA